MVELRVEERHRLHQRQAPPKGAALQRGDKQQRTPERQAIAHKERYHPRCPKQRELTQLLLVKTVELLQALRRPEEVENQIRQQKRVVVLQRHFE